MTWCCPWYLFSICADDTLIPDPDGSRLAGRGAGGGGAEDAQPARNGVTGGTLPLHHAIVIAGEQARAAADDHLWQEVGSGGRAPAK